VIRDVRDEFVRPVLGEEPNPASSLVQVAALVRPEFLVEVEAVAVVPDQGVSSTSHLDRDYDVPRSSDPSAPGGRS
jgi:hypothetical protein